MWQVRQPPSELSQFCVFHVLGVSKKPRVVLRVALRSAEGKEGVASLGRAVLLLLGPGVLLACIAARVHC